MSTVNKITVTKNSSSNTYGLKDIDALRSAALTNVENEFVATKAYAINDYLYRDDIFYKVIAPIPRGGTFVINQNIKATMLTNELAMLNPTVIANPTGEATGELETLQVGNIIYGVGSGGGSDLVSVIGSDDTETAVPTSKVTPIELTSSSFSGEDSSFIYFRLGRNATLNQRPTGVTYQDFGLYFSVNDSDAVLAYYNDSPITESDIYNLDKKKIYIGYLRAIAGDPVTYRFEIHEVDDMSAGIDNVIVGTAAHAEGKNTTAYGNNTHSEGSSTCAYGSNSHAEGQGTTAYGSQSHAEGASTYAIYVDSHAEGTGSTAYGQGSHAEGGSTYAKGLFSHSEGDITTAQGNYAHAEGISTYAIADYSHAEGYSTSSQGNYSHSEGMNTSAVGHQTHTEGNQCTALGDQSHAEGYKTYAYDDYAHAEGSQTCANLASHSENYYTRAIGNYAHAEGNYTTAGGSSSHAEGCYTYAADYAHAEGSGKAYGSYSHAEGNYTNTASGATGAHAEGTATCAKGSYSHAEGAYTTAIGEASHTQGQNTTATGNRSSAAGSHTAAGYNDQFVIGYYNDNKSTSIFEVGNGTYETASNALELDASGNLVVSGSITDGDGNILGPGGTTVVANPADPGTADLTKLQVGNTVYDVGSSIKASYGASNPSDGSDGDLYIKLDGVVPSTSYRYIKFDVLDNQRSSTQVMFDGFSFVDENNNSMAWPAGSTATCNQNCAFGADAIFYEDNNSKYIYTYGRSATYTITLPENAPLDILTYTKYKWKTGNATATPSEPGFYPKTWKLYLSNNNTDQTEVDSVVDFPIDQSYGRYSIVFRDEMKSLPTRIPNITDIYVNSEGYQCKDKFTGLSVESATENIENGATSSQAYAIGDFLYRNNRLYKAKTAIAQEDTFVIDTNIEETNITDEINTLKTNFQDGVDAVYNACVSKGSTPSSHSLADIIDAINNIVGTLGTKNITVNGTYGAASDNLDGYSSVTVNVHGGAEYDTLKYLVIARSGVEGGS